MVAVEVTTRHGSADEMRAEDRFWDRSAMASYSQRMRQVLGNMDRQPQSRLQYHLDSLLWIAAAAFTWWAADVTRTLFGSTQCMKWTLAGAAALSALAAVSVVLFLQFALPWIWGIRLPSDQWEVRYPRAFPVASALLAVAGLLSLVAAWPCYGIVTPPVLFFLGMGLFNALLYIRL